MLPRTTRLGAEAALLLKDALGTGRELINKALGEGEGGWRGEGKKSKSRRGARSRR